MSETAKRAADGAAIKLTPMLQQYLRMKESHPDAILLYRLGDFYEMFFEDAERASRLLDLTLTSRNRSDEASVPLCGVPHHAVQPYIQKLLDAGLKVAVCEQVEDPAAAKGIVERRVVRVVTPGTVLEEESLEPREASYLAAVLRDGVRAGLAVVDPSTGELRAGEIETPDLLADELARLAPREVVYAEGSAQAVISGVAPRRTSSLPRARFDAARFHRWLEERSPGAPDWRDAPLAAGALAGLLATLEDQLVPLDHLRLPARHAPAGFLAIDETSRRNLEIVATARGERRGSLLAVLDHTATPMGARTLRRWLLYPLVDPASIGERLDAVEELVESAPLRVDLAGAIDGFGDLERLAGRIGTRTASPRDMARLRHALAASAKVRDRLAASRAALLRRRAEEIDPLAAVQAKIHAALVDAPPLSSRLGDLIRAGHSAEVDELRALRRDGKGWISSLETAERARTGISSLKVRYNKVFGYYIEVTRPNLKLVPADYLRKQTIAGGERFVTPELKEHEAKVLGAEERLRRLEAELFDALVAEVAGHLAAILATASAIGAIDALASLAEVAERRRYVRPEIDRSRSLEIAEGRHPVVEQVIPAGRFVPNDVRLDPDGPQIVVLTGPNMAGKSTYLRQTALIVVLAQMGSFVPAMRARIGVVDRIFTRVGASDDLAAGDSTFMVEMKETAHILARLTERSLVVLDEIGRGTSTFDGISIAWAVAEHLHDSPARPKTLFATHFHELTELAATASRAANFSVAVKEWQGDVVFLRRIVPGPASQSYGIHVARLAGVPGGVVARAKEILCRLESGDHGDGEHPLGARSGAPQLALFAPRSPEEPLAAELRSIDPLALTPIEALQKLHELVERAKGRT